MKGLPKSLGRSEDSIDESMTHNLKTVFVLFPAFKGLSMPQSSGDIVFLFLKTHRSFPIFRPDIRLLSEQGLTICSPDPLHLNLPHNHRQSFRPAASSTASSEPKATSGPQLTPINYTPLFVCYMAPPHTTACWRCCRCRHSNSEQHPLCFKCGHRGHIRCSDCKYIGALWGM